MRLPRLALISALCPFIVCLAVFASPARAAEPGLVTGLHQTLPEAGTAQQLGARWVRVFMNWRDMEPMTAGVVSPAWLISYKQRIGELKARGVKVLVVVGGPPQWANGSDLITAPPIDPGQYARFMRDMAGTHLPEVDAWEIWNEADDDVFWLGGPQPDRYAQLLKATYPQIKAVQPHDTVITSGMVGNHYEFLEQLYALGAGGSFDAVGVHTDTACLVNSPDVYYREPNGRVGRFSFTGYRELHWLMSAHGDAHKGIWITEIGWNTSSTAANSCREGGPSGVSEATQAQFLTEAFQCLAADPYVHVALWFSTQDLDASGLGPHSFGLVRHDGTPKPAFGAFQKVAQQGVQAKPCGAVVDRTAPSVQIQTPTDGYEFMERIRIKAGVADNPGGVGIRRSYLWVDGKRIPFGDGDLNPWFASGALSVGPHKLTVRTVDQAGNAAEQSITIHKVRKLKRTLKTRTLMSRPKVRRSRAGTTVRVRWKTRKPAGRLDALPGRTHVVFQLRKKGRYKTMKTRNVRSDKPVAVAQKMAFKGRWRVQVRYKGLAPFKSSSSKRFYFTVR